MLAGVAHFAYLLAAVPRVHPAAVVALVPLGLIYSVSISWNINGISHNFLHNPYFRSAVPQPRFQHPRIADDGLLAGLLRDVHKRHHMGNADLPDESGKTIDPLSIYQHGHDGEPENVWTYIFFSYFRDDPKAIFRDIAPPQPGARRGGACSRSRAFARVLHHAGHVLNWRFIVYFLPFYYFGHCLSYLNGYYLHLRRQPRHAHRLGRQLATTSSTTGSGSTTATTPSTTTARGCTGRR